MKYFIGTDLEVCSVGSSEPTWRTKFFETEKQAHQWLAEKFQGFRVFIARTSKYNGYHNPIPFGFVILAGKDDTREDIILNHRYSFCGEYTSYVAASDSLEAERDEFIDEICDFYEPEVIPEKNSGSHVSRW